MVSMIHWTSTRSVLDRLNLSDCIVRISYHRTARAITSSIIHACLPWWWASPYDFLLTSKISQLWYHGGAETDQTQVRLNSTDKLKEVESEPTGGHRESLFHLVGRSHWGSQKAPQWQDNRVGFDWPIDAEGSGHCWVVLVDRSFNVAWRSKDSACGVTRVLGRRLQLIPWKQVGCILPTKSDLVTVSCVSQRQEGLHFWGLWISELLFADDVVLLASPGVNLQQSFKTAN